MTMTLNTIFISFLMGISSFSLAASEKALNETLASPHHLLMMRHADAPGYSDPPGFDLNNCASQRNLGANGKKQAAELGAWLKTQGITQAKLLSSPWCRCMETAKLLNVGNVLSENALGSFFENRADGKEQTLLLEKKIKQEISSPNRRPLILVTHQVNIQAYTGESVSSGQMILVKVNANGQYLSHRLIKYP
jgi:phosphohistidine phosphatase SixA